MNITKRNIEDIYDKDILRLQNLQNSLNGDVRKLKFDLSSALEDYQESGGGKRSSSGSSENLENLILEVQEEVRQMKKKSMNIHGLSDSFRNELNSMTIDIDELNKEKQANAIQIEQLKRHISQLEVEKIIITIIIIIMIITITIIITRWKRLRRMNPGLRILVKSWSSWKHLPVERAKG